MITWNPQSKQFEDWDQFTLQGERVPNNTPERVIPPPASAVIEVEVTERPQGSVRIGEAGFY